ncbi:MAG: hypothetical protein ACYSW0_23900, partial [Planctomycetota bacterium]
MESSRNWALSCGKGLAMEARRPYTGRMTNTTDIQTLIDELADVPGTEKLFNPYHGSGEKAAICRGNFGRYLEQMWALKPRVLLVSEAYGYRGARLTGVPLTSERVMLAGVEKFGLFGKGYRQTSEA